MRVLFIGGTRRGYLTLQALLGSGHPVVGILSLRQDEHERDRFEEPIRILAATHGVPLRETKWLKDGDYLRWIAEDIHPDVAFVVGCRILLPEALWRLPPLGTLAVHDSLLPEYRGFAPLNWSILNGESRTGVTLFHVSEQMDRGDVVGQRIIPLGSEETAPEAYERVCQATVEVILEACPKLAQGQAPRWSQDGHPGTYTCSRNPEDGYLDWSQSSRALASVVRALTSPYPGAFTYYQGRRLIVWAATEVPNPPNYVGRIPGRVVQVNRPTGWVEVLAGQGVLRLHEVQRPGEERTSAAQVITSVRESLGVSVPAMMNRLAALEDLVSRLQATVSKTAMTENSP